LHSTLIPYQAFGLTSSRVCIYEASTILSTLETDLWYWVIVGCGAEEETEGCVQIVGETECRILWGERERVEDLNIFLGFLFMGVHSSELKMLTIDDILGNKYMVCEIHMIPTEQTLKKKVMQLNKNG
jgi:hypothetical protein